MGNWNINIQGVGCHHNTSNPTDANLMATEFVKRLRYAGHHIDHATFTYGGKDQDVEAAVTSADDPASPPQGGS